MDVQRFGRADLQPPPFTVPEVTSDVVVGSPVPERQISPIDCIHVQHVFAKVAKMSRRCAQRGMIFKIGQENALCVNG